MSLLAHSSGSLSVHLFASGHWRADNAQTSESRYTCEGFPFCYSLWVNPVTALRCHHHQQGSVATKTAIEFSLVITLPAFLVMRVCSTLGRPVRSPFGGLQKNVRNSVRCCNRLKLSGSRRDSAYGSLPEVGTYGEAATYQVPAG